MGKKKMPELDTYVNLASNLWDESVSAAYRTKGLRAWHDHILLRVQKNIYYTSAMISLIFLLNESNRTKSNPGLMDFVWISKPFLWASGIDAATVVVNCVFICSRFVHETHLKQFREPSVLERLFLHIIPVPIVICFILLFYSVPLCVLDDSRIHAPFCEAFNYYVLKAILLIALLIEQLYFVYGLYHAYRHAQPLKRDGRRTKNEDYVSLLGDSDSDFDANSISMDVVSTKKQTAKMTPRTKKFGKTKLKILPEL